MTSPTTHAPPLLSREPGGHLFDGAEYRYTFVAPLLDDEESNPVAIARRTPLVRGGKADLVLLKQVVLPPEGQRRQRAAEELRLATRLHHPNIARVFDVEEYRNEPYVVMEYTQGLFLETALETAQLLGRELSLAFCAYTAAEVADALQAAWTCEDEDGGPLHIVHRAVCPMNIRLDFQGGVKLTDWGLAHARLLGRLKTGSKVLRAVLDYAAPEVMSRQPLDGRADLYSLGMVLLEMVSGQYPLDPSDVNLPPVESTDVLLYNARMRAERTAWASAGELAARIRRFGPEDVERVLGRVPASLKRILHKALHALPQDRYPSAGAMRDELRAWLRAQDKSFGPEQAARELGQLMRDKPLPEDTGAFPAEKGVLLTPEEQATVGRRNARREKR
ncbi:putative serine/threonine protein kinase [Cystobacter fuscus DSM 2262]|uniref:Serine/threonine protein kinase n=1 Tax=Cystobacter fuscus (strain ATCC 25194 / DSM 2262 / NBRC 100088 / M29) TaxID=1242864 RepID=S9QMH8_CYSF2|nr:serine/threonine-protein kinase [Cystobacter fuscus]EPX62484.1 putative serine/threonine protein kinase [Cystobacter fuscus DSM 2262]